MIDRKEEKTFDRVREGVKHDWMTVGQPGGLITERCTRCGLEIQPSIKGQRERGESIPCTPPIELKVQAEGRGIERMARQAAGRGEAKNGLQAIGYDGSCIVNWHGRTVFQSLNGEIIRYEPGDEWESELERLYYENSYPGIVEAV